MNPTSLRKRPAVLVVDDEVRSQEARRRTLEDNFEVFYASLAHALHGSLTTSRRFSRNLIARKIMGKWMLPSFDNLFFYAKSPLVIDISIMDGSFGADFPGEA
jgi:PleD family two-component response regulator